MRVTCLSRIFFPLSNHQIYGMCIIAHYWGKKLWSKNETNQRTVNNKQGEVKTEQWSRCWMNKKMLMAVFWSSSLHTNVSGREGANAHLFHPVREVKWALICGCEDKQRQWVTLLARVPNELLTHTCPRTQSCKATFTLPCIIIKATIIWI